VAPTAARAKALALAKMGVAPLLWLLEVLLLLLGVLALPVEVPALPLDGLLPLEEPVMVPAVTGYPTVLQPSANSNPQERRKDHDGGESNLATYD
jgi:hypothetical protein